MNVFHRIALQGLKKNRARTLVTVAGVALSAALVTAVVTFGVSMLQYMTRGASAKYGGWNAQIYGATDEFVQALAQDARVTGVVATQNIGYAALPGARNPDKPYLFIAGFSGEAFDALPLRLLAGRLPEDDSELLIPTHLAANGGVTLSVGDTLTLAVGERTGAGGALTQHDPYAYEGETLSGAHTRTYTVVGICGRPYVEETRAPGYTAITRAPEGAGESLTAYATLNSPFAVRAFVREIEAGGHACSLNDEVLRFTGLSGDRLFTTLLFTVAAVVIAIVMVGSVFLIYNAFSISLSERMRQFGVLMSVGASARQLRACVLFEGLAIGALGIPPGILLGLGGIGVTISAVAGRFSDILYADVPLVLCVSAPALAAAAAISLATILISAYLPARRAAATPVLACIRQTGEVKLDARGVRVPRWVGRRFGLTGTLALKNARRNRRRSRSIVLSLSLSIVLFVSANAFVINLQQASERAVVFTTYDIAVTADGMDDARMIRLFDKLQNVEGATDALYQASAAFSCATPAGALSGAFWAGDDPPDADAPVSLSMTLRFLDDSTHRAILKALDIADPAYLDGTRLLAVAKMDRRADRVLEPDEFDDLFAADRVTLDAVPAGGGAARALTVTPVEFVAPDELPVLTGAESLPYILEVFAPYALKDALLGDAPPLVKGMTFRSKTPGQTAARMEAILREEGAESDCRLYNLNTMLDESRNMVFIANVFAYAFIVIISLIAAANVFNTISTDVRLRRRELAMLRSVGLSERDLSGMMRFECVCYGLRALCFGLPLALIASLAIYRGMVAGGADSIGFTPPWAGIGISACSVLAVIFVAMSYASHRIRRENILDALRDELA